MGTQRIDTTFQVKRGKSSSWESLNPVLNAGEPGYATDTGIFKIGDGITPWKNLPTTKIRRDNLYNYSDSYIPANGEICLVDTPASGLRVKVGDGVTTFALLEYSDTIMLMGYFLNGAFYSDAQKTKEMKAVTNKFYIDLASAKLYIYDGTQYIMVSADTAVATEDTAGVVKLYKSTGTNEDGTMTQKSITDEIGKKMSATIDGEVISFE